MTEGAYTRSRSFIERYVIERASTFRPGQEDTDMWKAILDGKRAYRLIAMAAKDAEPREVVKLPGGNVGAEQSIGFPAQANPNIWE